SVIRFSRDNVPEDVPAIRTVDGVDVLFETAEPQVLLVGFGAMVGTALAAARLLQAQGIGVRVVDPVWALPYNTSLTELAAAHPYVVTVEDSGVVGGCGARLTLELAQHGHAGRIHNFGVPQRFQPHGSRGEVLEACGLTAQQVARHVVEAVSAADTPVLDLTSHTIG